MSRRVAVLGALLGVGLAVGAAWAGRCGTGRHEAAGAEFVPLPPAARSVPPLAYRTVAPVPTTAHVYTTEHFRVLWGDTYNALLPRWQDPDGDGPRPPNWVEALGTALEDAFAVQTGLGFPEPYGVGSCAVDPTGGCYIDAYVGNTGVVAGGTSVTIGSSYYALTEIDTDYQVAYFTFNFSAIRTAAVLRATAAHELFHAVQRAMDYPWDDEVAISGSRWTEEGWFLEATATWMEEETFSEIDDYVSYVDEFLAEPQAALNSQDGLHEYGAAVFVGYLWGRFGGAELLRSVYQSAYPHPDGLEGALRDGLGAGADLEDVVAGFWAAAAAPSTAVWADAWQFRTPPLLTAVSALPAAGYPSTWDRPGRFGANLIQLDGPLLPTTATLEWTTAAPADGSWRLGLHRGGSADAAVATPVSGEPLALAGTSAGPAVVAVVNAAATAGTRGYTVELGGDGTASGAVQWRSAAAPDPEPSPPASSSSGGSGGCFLGLLGAP